MAHETARPVLDPTEQRVMGSLLEKERTVPASYPMTLNGIRTACNQTSGRDPILRLTEAEIQAALDRLRPAGLTRVIHPSHGARQAKYRQVLDEVLTLDDGERAVLTLLLLRGAQTPGELRSRAERLHAFDDLGQVETALSSLATRNEPLVEELERRPGQKEQRWSHLLGPVDVGPETAADDGEGASAPVPHVETTGRSDAEVAELQAQLAAALAEIAELRRTLDELTAPPG